MKKSKHKDFGNVYLAVWIIILCAALYLLIQLASPLFSNKIGQAKIKFTNIVMSKLCSNVFESSSSLIQHSLLEDDSNLSFPIKLIAEGLTVDDFLIDEHITASKTEGMTMGRLSNKVRHSSSFKGHLSKDYILTNGSALNIEKDDSITVAEMPVDVIEGDFYQENLEYNTREEKGSKSSVATTMRTYNGTNYTLDNLQDINFLIRNFYIVDGGTRISDELFDSKTLLSKDMTLEIDKDKPQILIYHTHSQEAYKDSKPGDPSESVVGIGDYLARILEKKYGYNVIHDKTEYDMANGKLDRNKAYDYARKGISKILEENPSIEIVIDLHRDGADKRTTIIDGEETAQIMLLNGLSRDQRGVITYLKNPYLKDNLAFSLQLQIKSQEKYPRLFYKNYLNCYRYNLMYVQEAS